jgi:hypothetical protein
MNVGQYMNERQPGANLIPMQITRSPDYPAVACEIFR